MAITTEQIKTLYTSTSQYLNELHNQYKKSMNYYQGSNDIRRAGFRTIQEEKENIDKKINGKDDPLRKADNRVSSNFYQLLVDQEAGYLATTDPLIDVGTDEENERVKNVLGDSFALNIQNLIIDVSNAGVGWLHYWNDHNGNFKYGVVSPEQISPIYADNLENEVVAVIRRYQALNQESGKYETIVEYWNDEECSSFIKDKDSNFTPYNRLNVVDNGTGEVTGKSNTYKHDYGRVPFIKFRKNLYEKPELDKVKGSIDIYDKVYNGFANDLEDIQQTLVILKGYGSADLDEFMDAIKEYKAINVDEDGGVSQLQIEIPVEARQTMLDITKRKIFDEGQGIDPAKFMDNGALSGKAIKGLYAHLDLKASTTEKNFRQGLAELIRAIMQSIGLSDYENRNIAQTWTKNAIQDDLERAQAIAQLAPYMSEWSIAKANPYVEDVDAELEHKADEHINSDGYGDNKELEKALNPEPEE